MHPPHRTTALELMLDVLPTVRRLVATMRRHDRELADQLRRACQSIALNLGEADGNRDGNRRLRLETALGSTKEARVALRVATAWATSTRATRRRSRRRSTGWPR